MTLMIGAVRVLFAMSRDGLLRHGLARVDPRTGTPLKISLGRSRVEAEATQPV